MTTFFFSALFGVFSTNSISNHNRPFHWSPHTTPFLKINYDASVLESLGALRCVVNDQSGVIVECFGNSRTVSTVFMSEALTIRETCVFCLKAGIKEVVIESDNLSVIDWCNSQTPTLPWDC